MFYSFQILVVCHCAMLRGCCTLFDRIGLHANTPRNNPIAFGVYGFTSCVYKQSIKHAIPH